MRVTSFNPCFTGSPTVTELEVESSEISNRFNPCFTGSPTVTCSTRRDLQIYQSSFNPCFTGSPTVTRIVSTFLFSMIPVSILVLLEVLLLQNGDSWQDISVAVSILVLLEVLLLRSKLIKYLRYIISFVSILVLLEVLLLPMTKEEFETILGRVSILVLLEVLLLLKPYPKQVRFFNSGFNPCFTGSPTVTTV